MRSLPFWLLALPTAGLLAPVGALWAAGRWGWRAAGVRLGLALPLWVLWLWQPYLWSAALWLLLLYALLTHDLGWRGGLALLLGYLAFTLGLALLLLPWLMEGRPLLWGLLPLLAGLALAEWGVRRG